jgi:hypothetical protein
VLKANTAGVFLLCRTGGMCEARPSRICWKEVRGRNKKTPPKLSQGRGELVFDIAVLTVSSRRPFDYLSAFLASSSFRNESISSLNCPGFSAAFFWVAIALSNSPCRSYR